MSFPIFTEDQDVIYVGMAQSQMSFKALSITHWKEATAPCNPNIILTK